MDTIHRCWFSNIDYRCLLRIHPSQRKAPPKKILLVGILVGTIYLLFFSTATSAEEVSYIVDITPTEKIANSKIRVSRKIADATEVPTLEITPLPTPTKRATPTETPKERMVKVSIGSSMFNNWYQSFWEEKLLITIPECSPSCSGDEIISELGYAFSNDDIWVTVNIGRFYYAHSGWDPIKGPDFGDPFKRVVNSESDIKLCFDEECYQMIAYAHLSREEAGEPVFVNKLFEEIRDDDIFIITCGSGILPNQVSPKIVVQLQPQN